MKYRIQFYLLLFFRQLLLWLPEKLVLLLEIFRKSSLLFDLIKKTNNSLEFTTCLSGKNRGGKKKNCCSFLSNYDKILLIDSLV